MLQHRVVEGEPGIFPPGLPQLRAWLRRRRDRRDRARDAAPEAPTADDENSR